MFYIVGGALCLGLIIAAMYVVLTIGLSVYIAHANQVKGQMMAQQLQENEVVPTSQQLTKSQQAMASWGDAAAAEKKRDEDELSGKLPSLFSDPEDYGTEDNWLATMISREIAEMAYFTEHPADPVPDLKVKATVDRSVPQVQVEISGYGAETVTSDLQPVFAWDPNGYAPLAKQLLGTTSPLPAVPVTDENDALTHLLKLTGPELAAEDVRLSANLQAHPAAWQDHEEAALLLAAEAVRDEVGFYSDNRPLLCRATAHLAVAQALRGAVPASWPGLIAGAAIRTLAGRELDAMTHLDNLSAQADVPASAKPWIAALRMRAKQDWREAKVTPESPLLLKVVWFEMLNLDLVNDVPAEHLVQAVPVPPVDPNVAPDAQKTNPETLIADWSRIAGKSPFYDEADDNVKNAEYNMDLEFHGLDEILQEEKAAPFDLNHLDTVFAENATDTVSRGDDGKAVVHVIGPGGFKRISREHLFSGLLERAPVPDPNRDLAQEQDFFTKMDGLLRGVPEYDFARIHLDFLDVEDFNKQESDWMAEKKTWPVWEFPDHVTFGMPGYAKIKAFYRNAVPFGTVYATGRWEYIHGVNPPPDPPYNTPELEKIKQLRGKAFDTAIIAYNIKNDALKRASTPLGPTPFEQELLKLDPDNYDLATDNTPNDKLMPVAVRFLDYNMNPIERIERLDDAHLSDADRITILRKHVALEPEFGSRAGIVLRSKGLDDEAAEMERKAFASGMDPIAMSNVVLPLVDYDLRHGLNDEALKVAQAAGETNSEMGLFSYTYALERLGRLDEAEAAAKKDNDLYSDSWLWNFQLRHRDRYPDIYAAALKDAFPDGLVHATLSDFSGSPQGGDQIQNDSDELKAAGLQPKDIIVALDGYRVDSDPQYCFIRALTMDSKMDFIVWRGDKYLEVQASVPGRRMMVEIDTYQP